MTSLYRHLLRYFLVVSLVPLVLLGLFLTWDLQQRRRAEVRRELHHQTLLAKRLIERDPDRGPELLAHVAGREAGLRLTLIREDGTVAAESHQDPGRMESHLDRPELQQALRTGEGSAERYSETLRQSLLYVALPVETPSGRAVVRGAIPLGPVQAELARLRSTLLVVFAIGAAAAALMALRFSRRVSQPLEVLSRAARRVGEGEWATVSQLSGPTEVRQLTRDVNGMVQRLRELVDETDAGRAQLEAILAQMDDGLLVLDAAGGVLRMNAAARRLLEVQTEPAPGRSLLETVPLYPLEQVARLALAGERTEPVELRSPGGAALRVLASPLRPVPAGAILLIQDLTEIRRLDQMRRDFVANVSHELRTPIATLRALAETLQLRAGRHPEIVEEYAARVGGEVQRLQDLVEDLLTLSQIESGRWELHPEGLEPAELVNGVVQRFEVQARARGITLVAEPAPMPRIRADRAAVETALGNLVDNALKYTPSGGEVRVSTRADGGRVVFTVCDTGIGMAPEDLPRIFERFYRVDPARSQEVEGTGLGLAIVKHLSEQQGGTVWVESELGRGSRFHLSLAALQEAAEPAEAA